MSRGRESGSRVDHESLRRLVTSFHTPCPDRRSIRFVQPPESEDSSGDNEALEDVCGKNWKMFRVSPLHRFEYSPIRLRQYSKKLREHLAIMKNSEGNLQYKAVFSIVPDLKRLPQDYDAVKVTVSCSKDGRVFGSAYEGLLMSWGSLQPTTQQKGIVNLPLLLCRGTVGLTDAVHSLLFQFFDCCISNLLLTEEELFWLSAMLPAICPSSRKNSVVNFHFTVPGLTRSKGSFSFSCQQQTLEDIWKSFYNSEKEELLYSEIMTLHNGLMEHIQCVYGINVGMCHLDRIMSNDLYLGSRGQLKVRSTVLADKILTFVCSISTLVNSAVPSLSAQNE